jgi:hypothetical protein
MPKNINVPLSEDEYEKAKEAKDSRGLSWREFIKTSADILDESGEDD